MCLLIPVYDHSSPGPLRLAQDGIRHSILPAFVVTDVSVRVTRLSNENSSSSNRAPTFAICMSSFSLCEALRHLIAKSLILFGSCKHFESEFNPDGPKKINSPHLIPHPELMERGTLGFFFLFFFAHMTQHFGICRKVKQQSNILLQLLNFSGCCLIFSPVFSHVFLWSWVWNLVSKVWIETLLRPLCFLSHFKHVENGNKVVLPLDWNRR